MKAMRCGPFNPFKETTMTLPKNLINYDLLAWQRSYRAKANANNAKTAEKLATAALLTGLVIFLTTL